MNPLQQTLVVDFWAVLLHTTFACPYVRDLRYGIEEEKESIIHSTIF